MDETLAYNNPAVADGPVQDSSLLRQAKTMEAEKAAVRSLYNPARDKEFHGILDNPMGGTPTGSTQSEPSYAVERRIRRAVQHARDRSDEFAHKAIQTQCLESLLNCLPRNIPFDAAEGLRYLLDLAGF